MSSLSNPLLFSVPPTAYRRGRLERYPRLAVLKRDLRRQVTTAASPTAAKTPLPQTFTLTITAPGSNLIFQLE
ncbi:MAG: hypothetical protein U1F68_00265 [Gammaproteobacteria bacterium]